MGVAALARLADTVVDDRFKGVPLGASVALSRIGDQGWNVARGDLALPVTTLNRSALENNLTAMAEYCTRHGVLFAPHGKTTMAPQLFARQLAAGAWGITAATATQAAVMHRFGVRRIVVANELTEPTALRWVAERTSAEPDVEILSLADSAEAVTAADRVLAAEPPARPLPLLVEVGLPGGRSGVRSVEQAVEVARAVRAARHLELAGVETYEGLAASGGAPADLRAVDALLDRARAVVVRLAAAGLFDRSTILVTAGGSSYFDRVVAKLGRWTGPAARARLVLRAGCYLTHDLGKYHHESPLDGRRDGAEPLQLRNALSGWASVVSRPEPELVILGTGKRDLPYDVDLPTPLAVHPADGGPPTDLRGRAEVRRLMDQHAFLHLPAALRLVPGDIVELGMSHPCTAFDKQRLLPVIDGDHTVVDGVLTFF